MTTEEAIKILQREKDYVQQAMKNAVDGNGYVSPDGLIRADDYVEACDVAISSIRAQREPNDWICTLKCKALMDEGICEHGGMCCLYESQRVIKENAPLTLDELREMDGEPVWVVVVDHQQFCDIADDFDGWGMCRKSWVRVWDELRADLIRIDYDFEEYGKKWLAYRRKPEEGTP